MRNGRVRRRFGTLRMRFVHEAPPSQGHLQVAVVRAHPDDPGLTGDSARLIIVQWNSAVVFSTTRHARVFLLFGVVGGESRGR